MNITEQLHELFSKASVNKSYIVKSQVRAISKNADMLVTDIAKQYGYVRYFSMQSATGFKHKSMPDPFGNKAASLTNTVREKLATGLVYFNEFSPSQRQKLMDAVNKMRKLEGLKVQQITDSTGKLIGYRL